MSESTAPKGPGWWRPLHRTDRWALALLVALPTLFFVLPALLGYPAIAQDNLIQNFPLRILSAHQMLSGHLPLFNSLANSGTPLLGGLNAGSFYPLEFLYFFLPPVAAWVINLIVVYVTASLGVYCLCRWHGLRSSAALIAGVAFAYSGAMIGQMVHLGVIEGFALLPWLVLTELVLARRLLQADSEQSWRRQAVSAVPAVLGLAVIWALTFLSGEPRAIAEIELVSLVVVAVELLLHRGVTKASWRARAFVLVANGVGALWGAGIALAQLLPGWAFISQSERSNVSYQFFGSGSTPVRWSAMLFDQNIFGGNGFLGTPLFFTNYNLAEVTGYVGLLAVTATFAFFVQLLLRQRRKELRPFLVYGVLCLVGLFATWGSFSPLGHLFHALPLFGKTRLQSRNIIVVDLAAVVLLGWWLDAVFSKRRRDAALLGWKKFVTATPAFLTVVLLGSVLLYPISTQQWLGTESNQALARGENPEFIPHLIIALGVLVVLFAVKARRSRQWLIGLMVADLLVFNLFVDLGVNAGVSSVTPSAAAAAQVLGTTGRFAFVDESQTDLSVFESLGAPNMNVATGLPSIQGYGSLVSSRYGTVTGTHPYMGLSVCGFVHGAYVQLRLATIVLSPSGFVPRFPVRRHLTWCGKIESTNRTARFFGALYPVSSIRLKGRRGALLSRGTIYLQLFGGSGESLGPPIAVASSSKAAVTIHNATPAAGFRIIAPKGVLVGSAAATVRVQTPTGASGTGVRTSTQLVRLDLDSAYQGELGSSRWHLVATTNVYQLFHASSVRPAQWLEGSSSGDRIVSARTSSWGDEWITVTARHSVELVRSVAWLPGWRADVTRVSTNSSAATAVRRHGLIQRVTLGPGRWSVHFHYHAPYIELGLIVSFLSTMTFAAALWLIVRPRIRARLRGSVNR